MPARFCGGRADPIFLDRTVRMESQDRFGIRYSPTRRHSLAAATQIRAGIDALQQQAGKEAGLQPPEEHYRLYAYDLAGVYQIGEDQPRCWMVAGTPLGSGRWFFTARSVDQRGVGISSTRA